MPAECPCGAPALEDGLCGFCLEHSPSMVRAVLRRQRDRIEVLRDSLRFVRQTVHQAHHEGAIESCPKNTCDAATKALAGARHV